MSVGNKLYFSVLAVFLLFAVAFIVFQQTREKQYKIDTLNMKLQDYNAHLEESLREDGTVDEAWLNAYVAKHDMPNLRVTIITPDGKVVYDNLLKEYSGMNNHASRPEIAHALTHHPLPIHKASGREHQPSAHIRKPRRPERIA